MSTNGWQEKFQAELERAEQARLAGNEGMARVCARRAAGLAIGERLARMGLEAHGPSAYDRLRYFHALPGLSPQIQAVIEHFLVRITTSHELPVEADLIAEARWLAGELLGSER